MLWNTFFFLPSRWWCSPFNGFLYMIYNYTLSRTTFHSFSFRWLENRTKFIKQMLMNAASDLPSSSSWLFILNMFFFVTQRSNITIIPICLWHSLITINFVRNWIRAINTSWRGWSKWGHDRICSFIIIHLHQLNFILFMTQLINSIPATKSERTLFYSNYIVQLTKCPAEFYLWLNVHIRTLHVQFLKLVHFFRCCAICSTIWRISILHANSMDTELRWMVIIARDDTCGYINREYSTERLILLRK